MGFGGTVTVHIREVKPKDFYYAQLLRQKEHGFIPLVLRLILNPDSLEFVTVPQTRAIFEWASETVLQQNVLTVENWLEIAYHLCKQRWDASVDWLEEQPMSKIQTMIEIVKKHAEDQEKEMKKSARRK